MFCCSLARNACGSALLELLVAAPRSCIGGRAGSNAKRWIG
jgi:hypothetical protein